ncbi:hypothetical protein Phou_080860 [Phytohabitans houttuyneae]|uniref:NB-ARC domain-containing protein n=1 Tax=Phytohabitans houttuyneae TaxID=1076126 RepID=A0A6V8KPZ2_9ACTN|nr:hypothetical protein Phou_080860 [Phytohabitans houttuyneae]
MGMADWLWRDGATRRLEAIDRRFGAWQQAGAGQVRRGLPGAVSDFTGRHAVLADLRGRLARHDPGGPSPATCAVTGMGGVGKTTLAVHAAREAVGRYADGAFFIDLHGFSPGMAPLLPEAALEQLLRDAGERGDAIPLAPAARRARWCSIMAERKAIVVLDNAENSAQIGPLLPGAPGCLVIVTSRRRLTALPEVDELVLDVLSPDDAEELFVRVAGAERAYDPAEVRQVARLCDHLPLAIRIVAARHRDEPTRPLRAVLADLSDQTGRLAELSPEGAGVLGALHLTTARMGAEPARALRLLGLHPGPLYRAPALAHLAEVGEAEARTLLRTLADHHLLTPTKDGYQCHDLVRAFVWAQSRDHIDPAERDAAHARLHAWYERVAEESAPEWLTVERDNLVAFCLGSRAKEVALTGLSAADRLSVLGFYDHARGLYNHFRLVCVDAATQAKALFGLGDLVRLTFGEIEHAVKRYTEARERYLAAGDQCGAATALLGIAHMARITGDNASALLRYQEAVETFVRLRDVRGEAYATWGLAAIRTRLGDLDQARDLFAHALDLDIRTGYEFGQAEDERGLGGVAFCAGDMAEARTRFNQAYGLACTIGYRRGQAHNLLGLGRVARATDELAEARRLFTEALMIYEELGLDLAENARTELATVAVSVPGTTVGRSGGGYQGGQECGE